MGSADGEFVVKCNNYLFLHFTWRPICLRSVLLYCGHEKPRSHTSTSVASKSEINHPVSYTIQSPQIPHEKKKYPIKIASPRGGSSNGHFLGQATTIDRLG